MEDGPLFCVPATVSNFDKIKKPIPAKFYSAHFSFTDGNFCKLIPHDPSYYFYGEETNITVRAFTHGYDLYHPNKVIGWHQYNRKYRPTHWNDNPNSWKKIDTKSNKKHRALFNMDAENKVLTDTSVFGTVRSIKDYELYAGIRFSDRYINEDLN
jgi:hypothetical protein